LYPVILWARVFDGIGFGKIKTKFVPKVEENSERGIRERRQMINFKANRSREDREFKYMFLHLNDCKE